MFIKKVISYLLLAFVVISSACIREKPSSIPTAPPINYPDKNLQEIVTAGILYLRIRETSIVKKIMRSLQ